MPESPLINIAGPEDKLFPVAGQLVGYDSFDEWTEEAMWEEKLCFYSG